MPTLTIRDQTAAGRTTHELTLDVLSECITVRELIRSRVFQEVKDYNARRPEYFRSLVQPTDAEATLNGYRMRKMRKIDWHPQYAKVIAAFEKNQILVLVDDNQVDSLDDEITIGPGTSVSFLRLVPLVGG